MTNTLASPAPLTSALETLSGIASVLFFITALPASAALAGWIIAAAYRNGTLKSRVFVGTIFAATGIFVSFLLMGLLASTSKMLLQGAHTGGGTTEGFFGNLNPETMVWLGTFGAIFSALVLASVVTCTGLIIRSIRRRRAGRTAPMASASVEQ